MLIVITLHQCPPR